MKFANANKLHRKIRGRGTRPGVRVLCGLSGFSHRLFRAGPPGLASMAILRCHFLLKLPGQVGSSG